MAKESRDLVLSVDKAMDILEVLAKSKSGFGVSQLSADMGLPKTTAFRLLNTLMSKGYVERDPGSENYRLGLKVLLLGNAILDRMDLRGVARPFIEALALETREVVHCAVLDADEVVYIDKVESLDHPIRIYSQIGRRVPAHCTGLGKVFLAWMGEKDLESYLSRKELTRFTDATITEPAALRAELSRIRERGYSLDDIEHEEGIRCVAAPIFDRRRELVAAVSVSGPTIYITKERLPSLIASVIEATKGISRNLGYSE